MVFVILLIYAGVGGLIGYAIGNSKGRGTEGFWLGFFLGIIGWIIVAFQQPAESVATERAALAAVIQGQAADLRERDRLRPCPSCAEPIRPEARVCRFCGRDVEPVQVDESTELAAVQQQYPSAFDVAVPYLNALAKPPTSPASWLRELCRRIDAGSPAEAAAARIPLDWLDPAIATTTTPVIEAQRAPTEAGEYPSVASQYPRQYDIARSTMASLAERPVHPEAWLTELCRRVEAGSPPAAAAERIPLEWS
jgi:hypothetical protein